MFRPVASNTSPGSCASVLTTDPGSEGMTILLTPTTFHRASNQDVNVSFPMGSKTIENFKFPLGFFLGAFRTRSKRKLIYLSIIRILETSLIFVFFCLGVVRSQFYFKTKMAISICSRMVACSWAWARNEHSLVGGATVGAQSKQCSSFKK